MFGKDLKRLYYIIKEKLLQKLSFCSDDFEMRAFPIEPQAYKSCSFPLTTITALCDIESELTR